MSFENNLSETAQSLRNSVVPAELRARTLDRVADEFSVPVDPRDDPSPSGILSRISRNCDDFHVISNEWINRRPFVAVAIVSVLLVGIMLYLGRDARQGFMGVSGPVSAATVSDAIHRASSWHFIGWRLQSGKPVRWEVWGRRDPFFYREQVGDSLLIDDGKKRIRIVPPDRMFREHGYYFVLPSLHQLNDNGSFDMGADFLMSGEAGSSFRYKKAVGHTIELSNEDYRGPLRENDTLIVNAYTKLPISYTVMQTQMSNFSSNIGEMKPIRTETRSELRSEYNVTLPSNLALASLPSGYTLEDGLDMGPRLPNGDSVTAPSIGYQNGLTLQGSVIGRDPAGDLHIRLHAWIGTHPILSHDWIVSSDLMVDAMASTPVASDDLGNQYLPISNPDTDPRYTDNLVPEIWLVPTKPETPGKTPRILQLNTPATFSYMELLEAMPMAQGNKTVTAYINGTEPVISGHYSLQLAIPPGARDLGYGSYHDPGNKSGIPPLTLAQWALNAQKQYAEAAARSAGTRTR